MRIVDNWMPIRIGHLPTLGRRAFGRRARGRHGGSGVSLGMGRRAGQHRRRELAGQLTTDLLR